MARSRRPQPPAGPIEAPKDWKPTVCEFPGCRAKYPNFSLTGSKGPWYCHKHYLEKQAERDRPVPGGGRKDRLLL